MYLHFHPSRRLARVAALACATAVTPLAAADDAAPPLTREQMLSGQPAVPPVIEDQGIEHLIGGVGSDERARLRPPVKVPENGRRTELFLWS